MSRLVVWALPRDPNPYQEELYSAMRTRGAAVGYLGELTRSHSINLALLPLELVWRRYRGGQILHLHWTFGFHFPGADRVPLLRRAARVWFGLVLAVTHLCGLRLVWTVHNVLPHAPVFDDDLAARQRLAASADLTILHSESALAALNELGVRPRRTTVIPQGIAVPDAVERSSRGPSVSPRRLLFFGKIESYKGVEDLLAAYLASRPALKLMIVGACTDPLLRARISLAAADCADGVELMLEHVPDPRLSHLFQRAALCVFPFREVTTSSSVLFAMAAGRGVIVPDLPAFRDLPDEAVIRYPVGLSGLAEALAAAAGEPLARLVDRGRVARRFAARFRWADIARLTEQQMSFLVDPGS